MSSPHNIKKSLSTITVSSKVIIIGLVALLFSGRAWSQTLGAPTAFPSNMTATTFTLTWTSSLFANYYTIDVSTTNTFASGTYSSYGTSGTMYVVSGLLPSTTYYYRLQAVKTTNPTDYSGYSAVHTATTTIAAPVAPVAISPDNATIEAKAFTARWTAVTNATSYQLDVSKEFSFSSFVINSTNVTGATSYAVTGLSAGTDYYYRVRATNVGGSSPNSNVILTGTLTQIPIVNGSSYPTSESFIANWSATPGAVSYQLQTITVR